MGSTMDVLSSFNIMNFIKNNPFSVTVIALTVTSFALFKKWMAGIPCPSNARMDGKTVIITGANTGIGKETAIELSRRGASVIIACRDAQKAKTAVKDIQFITGNSNIKFMQLDLASFNSIRAFSQEVLETVPQIHILINNAGVMASPSLKTKDGHEMQFGVNHLGHFLLTLLLLDRIKDSAPARIINVSSRAHERGKIRFDDLNSEKKYTPFAAYSQSKLANIHFTRELAKHLEGTNVTTYCLHPGVIQTELSRHIGTSYGYFIGLLYYIAEKLIFITPKQGAQTSIYCAVAEELAKESGYYYNGCQRTDLYPFAKDDGVAKKLWKISEEITGVKI